MNIKCELIDVLKINRNNREYFTEKRNFCVLSYRLSGSAVFYSENMSCVADENNVLCIPPNISYSQKSGEEELIAIHFKCKEALWDNISLVKPYNLPVVKELFKKLYVIYSEKNIGNEFLSYSVFYEILYNLFTEEINNSNSLISESVKYTVKNFRNSNLSVKEIARASNISEVYFRKHFKKQFGKTPIEYINEQRIQYACSLLRGNYLSIDETAYEAGFNNPKYFSKVFKDITGMTPGKYRSTGFQ